TISGVSGACTALPCTIASLASGANTTIFVIGTINAAGAFDNSATATGTKNGPSTATNIQVTDSPVNLTITNVSGVGCAALPCTIASLASGANVTINVTATITSPGVFDNIATATAKESDPVPANNTDNVGNGGEATTAADLSIVKTLTTAGPYNAGQSVTFSLLITNAGPSTATSIQVTDTPSNLTITNVTGACGALPCGIVSLGVGANTTITVTATINSSGSFG